MFLLCRVFRLLPPLILAYWTLIIRFSYRVAWLNNCIVLLSVPWLDLEYEIICKVCLFGLSWIFHGSMLVSVRN